MTTSPKTVGSKEPAAEHHPDKGGDAATMAMINAAYDAASAGREKALA